MESPTMQPAAPSMRPGRLVLASVMGWGIPLGILALAAVFDLAWLAAGVLVAAWFRRGCP